MKRKLLASAALLLLFNPLVLWPMQYRPVAERNNRSGEIVRGFEGRPALVGAWEGIGWMHGTEEEVRAWIRRQPRWTGLIPVLLTERMIELRPLPKP